MNEICHGFASAMGHCDAANLHAQLSISLIGLRLPEQSLIFGENRLGFAI